MLPEDAQSAGLRHVVVRDGRLIATGTALTGDGTRPFSAVSGDGGDSWEFAWLPAEAPAVVLDLTASERGIVAVGAHGTGSEVDSSVWASEDGLVWVRHGLVEDGLGGPGAQWLEAVTISGQRVIAVGRSTTSTTDNITIWRSTLSLGGRPCRPSQAERSFRKARRPFVSGRRTRSSASAQVAAAASSPG